MGSRARRQEVTLLVHDDGPVGLDDLEVVFDDERVVSDAGIALAAPLAARLKIERLSSGWCDCGRSGRARPARAAR